MIEIDQHDLTHSFAFNRHIKIICLLVMCLFIYYIGRSWAQYMQNAQWTLHILHMAQMHAHMYATRERGYLHVIEGKFTEIMIDGISAASHSQFVYTFSFRFRSVFVCFGLFWSVFFFFLVFLFLFYFWK